MITEPEIQGIISEPPGPEPDGPSKLGFPRQGAQKTLPRRAPPLEQRPPHLASPMSIWIHDVSSGRCSRHVNESRCFLKGTRLLLGPFWRTFLRAAGESQNPNILPLKDRNSTTNCGFARILERNNYCLWA